MALSPDHYRKIITFENLLPGEAFEFSRRIDFSGFRRNQTARKISENTYEMGNAKRRIWDVKAPVRRVRHIGPCAAKMTTAEPRDMNDLDAGILRCPITKKPLAYRSASMLASEDGAYGYPIVDGILLLTVDKAIDLATVRETGTSVRQEKQSVRDFYDRFGWKRTASGKYGDTTRFVDQRELSYGFTESCMRRVGTYLPQSGTYLLDAGSGAIPHRTYMDYHANYERRICVDFSIEALHEAKRKLGDRGVYILGDITNLPLSDNAMDAVISNHVIYHVPADEQARAFEELWRVTRPGGRAVVVYSWEGASLPRWIRQFATRVLRLRKNEGALPQEQGGKLNFYFHSHTLKWFQEQAWPFQYTIRSFRVVNNEFLRSYLADNTRSQLLVGLLRGMQRVFSGWCGRHGQYPIIVIPK